MENRGFIRLLRAGPGNCIHLRYLGEDNRYHNIIIDGGPAAAYRLSLREAVREISANSEAIDLLIVTHLDADHIGGILAFLSDSTMAHAPIRLIFFNSGAMIAALFKKEPDGTSREVPFNFSLQGPAEISITQGRTLEKHLSNGTNWHPKPVRVGEKPFELAGAKLTILSPGIAELEALNRQWATELGRVSEREISAKIPKQQTLQAAFLEQYERDTSIPNGSSIAFLFEFQRFKMILGADAHAEVLARSLESMGFSPESPLPIDLYIVSHHGSKKNTSPHLLSLLDCRSFAFSTDGSGHGHPDLESIARIIQSRENFPHKDINLLFNHESLLTLSKLTDREIKEHRLNIILPESASQHLTFPIPHEP